MLEGAWISLVSIIVLIYLMKKVCKHYEDVAHQLRLDMEEIGSETAAIDVNKHVIVVVGSLNKASLKAINYARQLSSDKNVVAFNVAIDMESSERIQAKWKECNIPILLIVKYSPYREVIGPLVDYIKSEEPESSPGDMINIVIPQFVVSKPWENILHNQTSYAIKHKLMHDRHIAIINVPYVLE
jgi:hypothetical protein